MCNDHQKRSYSPQFSDAASAAIRRLAWVTGKPMTRTLHNLIMALPAILDPSKICLSCLDNSSCKDCIFSRYYTAEEKAALLAEI